LKLSSRITLCVALAVGAALVLLDRAPLRDRPGLESARAERPRLGEASEAGEEAGPYPSDWFGAQRAFPDGTIPQQQFREGFEQAQVERAGLALGTSSASSLPWVQAGPYNIGGRVTALAVAPGGVTVYLGAANGGVFKSTNSGVNWTPIFDDYGVYSIGALALDPADPGVLYVGTGEANASVDSYDGAGLFRTRDGGQGWELLGLAETARIGRVAVDPGNPDRIFVAAMGTQFSTGPDRGLYRSEDGGASWTKVLFLNDSTGVCDVAINPAHPETVFCASWERVRHNTYRRAYGPGCGIWRSVDHGATWVRLQTGLPVPSDNVGRIGLAIAASRPSTIYAQIITGTSGGYQGLGLYRSTDGGATWLRRDTAGFTGIFGGFGWYFGDMAVDPTDPNRVFAMGVELTRSTDGGVNNVTITGLAHVDQHAMWIDPGNPSRVYLGNDGGFFWSLNGGSSWDKSWDLPITQFYAGAIDPSNALRLLGGTQDNFTLITTPPDYTPYGWDDILGGDGFQCLVDPTNPQVLFAEYQNCCSGTGLWRSVDGGSHWTQPSGFSAGDRYNWNTPIAMDPTNHNVLLVGSQRVYKSTNNGVNYSTVSADLTTNPVSSLVFGTITTLAISPVNPAVYYAGTDDGRVWRSTNTGANWTNISAGLPVRWVTRVTPDPSDAQTVYVTLSGFSRDEHAAHVYRSGNQGNTWNSISGNLPNVPANDILVDPADPLALYLATDVGVYATLNQGAGWFPLGKGMPVQTVFDLTFHAPTRTLVAATHGRSQWKLDLTTLPLAVARPAPPPRLALSVPAPNPSRGQAHLSLDVSRATRAEVTIYDAAGRRVRNLLRGPLAAGRHALVWDGRDERGRLVSSGVYFVRASASNAVVVRRVVRAE
jgi:photosystem II stability/assembly factor-like uncharacterized protein